MTESEKVRILREALTDTVTVLERMDDNGFESLADHDFKTLEHGRAALAATAEPAKVRCFVEKVLGGGRFVCDNPVTVNGWCDEHGKQDARTFSARVAGPATRDEAALVADFWRLDQAVADASKAEHRAALLRFGEVVKEKARQAIAMNAGRNRGAEVSSAIASVDALDLAALLPEAKK